MSYLRISSCEGGEDSTICEGGEGIGERGDKDIREVTKEDESLEYDRKLDPLLIVYFDRAFSNLAISSSYHCAAVQHHLHTAVDITLSDMEIVNVQDYEAVAKEKLPKMVYDYYASGAEDQWTLKENQRAFQRIRFRPRILVDVSKIDTSSTMLGFKISMPIMIAPTAMQKMAHPDGELATARAASAAGTIMV
ncbi:hypothetical protein SUGI_1147170 [Cryptomeria japonica]|nr:hypothetical protein SUGI_1147170 [Cryptomeria japonica]